MKGLSINKSLLLVGALAGLILAIGLLPQGTAKADPWVPTQANVSGADPRNAPVIEWKWELPDMNDAAAGIQYDSPGDHDSSVFPATPPVSHNMMQVAPNLEDDPAPQLIEYWVAVQDPNGLGDIQTVWVNVYEPPNVFKYKLHLDRVTCNEATLGNWNLAGTVLGAAYETGQMTAAEAGNILYQCNQNNKAVYHAVGDISKHQPCGEYRVEAGVTDLAGNVGTMTNWFDVLCVVGLEIDFDAVDWGGITPGVRDWVQGDWTWDRPPGGSVPPTVKNTGNTPMFVGLGFTEMVGYNFNQLITVFDARLIDLAGDVTIDPISTWTLVTFPNPLQSNEQAKLDVSIHPQWGLPADWYNGWMWIQGSP
ncbi:MAG: hypothetical protein Q8P22_01425 [Chloroflexota bacterium]|nr:hypothetical protein [Chloroflexota bacterium]